MQWPSNGNIVWFVGISGFTVILDQLTKNWMLDLIFLPQRQLVLSPFLNLTPVWNSGISFGLFRNQQVVGQLIIPVLALLVVLWLFFTLYELNFLQRCSAGLIAPPAIRPAEHLCREFNSCNVKKSQSTTRSANTGIISWPTTC